MTGTRATIVRPCDSRTRHVTSHPTDMVKVPLHVFCQVKVIEGPETPHHAPLICSSHQTSLGGYLRCADFVLFFATTNINSCCWLCADTEINRWRRRTFFRGTKIILNDKLSAAGRLGSRCGGSPPCDGGDQLAASHTGYSRHLSSPSPGPGGRVDGCPPWGHWPRLRLSARSPPLRTQQGKPYRVSVFR